MAIWSLIKNNYIQYFKGSSYTFKPHKKSVQSTAHFVLMFYKYLHFTNEEAF